MESHQFAIKIIDLKFLYSRSNEMFVEQLINESKISINLNHENVVKEYFYYKIPKENCLFIFMEFCNSRNLADYLYKKKQKNIILEEEEIKLIFFDILKVLDIFDLFSETLLQMGN